MNAVVEGMSMTSRTWAVILSCLARTACVDEQAGESARPLPDKPPLETTADDESGGPTDPRDRFYDDEEGRP